MTKIFVSTKHILLLLIEQKITLFALSFMPTIQTLVG